MPALTETEATARAALLDVASYEVFADLTGEPVRSRTEIRFGCREPGAATFAELTATATRAVLNGRELSRGMRLMLQEQEAILRAALAARSVPRRWS